MVSSSSAHCYHLVKVLTVPHLNHYNNFLTGPLLSIFFTSIVRVTVSQPKSVQVIPLAQILLWLSISLGAKVEVYPMVYAAVHHLATSLTMSLLFHCSLLSGQIHLQCCSPKAPSAFQHQGLSTHSSSRLESFPPPMASPLTLSHLCSNVTLNSETYSDAL